MYKRRNYHSTEIICGVKMREFDTFESQGYTLNDSGFIRNDFSELQARENELGYMRALSQMQEYAESHSTKGMTFEEIVSSVRPRWCQLPNEVDRFEQYCIDNAIEFYKKLKDDSTREGQIAKEVVQGTSVSDPADVSAVPDLPVVSA